MMSDKIATGEALSGQQSSASTLALLDAVEILGGPSAAMILTNLSKADFSRLAAGSAVASRELSENLELLTAGKVGKHRLRPDLWIDPSDPVADVEGVDVSHLCGRDLEYRAAFEAYRAAFNDAVADPRVSKFRTCIFAADHLQRVAGAK